MKVRLSESEIRIGSTNGADRKISSISGGFYRGNHKQSSGWSEDIEGALAEMALCKHMGLYWTAGVNTFKHPDVGQDIQVRSTTRDDGCLIVRDDDSDDHRFYLVIGSNGTYEIVGWLYGSEAKKDKWARNPGGYRRSFFVPQKFLRSIDWDI